MNCSEFEKELEQLVETRGESLPEPALAHLERCADCRLLHREHQLINIAIAKWRPVEIPASLLESVMNQVIDERLSRPIPAAPSAASRRGWFPVAAIACLLVIIGVGIGLRPDSNDPTLAQNGNPPPLRSGPDRGAPVEVATSMAAVLDDLTTEYRGLAADTTATARELAVVIPTAPAIPWGDLSVSNIASKSTVVDQDPESATGVTEIGRTIGTQITQAMDFLWTSVPAEVPRG